jgi:dTDP-4-dehydrorhamnose reductase
VRTVSIIGASGFVGGRLFRRLREGASDGLEVSGTCHGAPPGEGLSRLDVTDLEALSAHLERGFDLVVVAAGTKDVARCEADFAFARALNASPVEEMVRIVERERLHTRIVYLSTDYVFDGERGLYREDDPPDPRTRYGRSKLLGERAVLAGAGHKVVRSAAVMGRGGRFFDWLVGALGSDGDVPLYEDSYFSPTPAGLLCDAMRALLCGYDAVPQRVLHLVGDRRLSRLDLGRVLAGMIPGAGARLVPVHRRAGKGSQLQRDLSLVPSDLVRRLQPRSFEAYLAEEVAACVA